jgi:hypothetical protein
MPVLDAASVVPPTVLRRPVLAFAGTTAFKRGIFGRLESTGLERRIADAFAVYSRQLEAWRQTMLGELRAAFLAQWALLPGAEGSHDRQSPDERSDTEQRTLADLQRLDAIP